MVSQHVSFDVKGGKSGYNLTDLPLKVIDNVSLVVILAAVYHNPVHPAAYLPSAVLGPVTPSVLATSTIFCYFLLIIVSTVVAESPEVVVSGDGSGVTGTSYTLTCRVSLPSGVEPDSLDIQWLGLPTPQPVMISTGVYISNVTLNPLLPNNSGYTCTASYTINGVSSRLVIESICITDISKFFNHIQ